MNKITQILNRYPKLTWFIVGVIFAHFGWHIEAYKKGGELVEMVDERINPAPSLADRIWPF